MVVAVPDIFQQNAIDPKIADRAERVREASAQAQHWLTSARGTWSNTEDWTVRWDLLSSKDKLDLFTMLGWFQRKLFLPRVPNPKQLAALVAPQRGMSEPILFGGGMGGGKSATLVMGAIKACRSIPNNRALLARFTYAALRISTLLELEEQLVDCPDAIHQKGNHRVWFPETNSYIWYFGLGRPAERQRVRSTMWGWIGIDEVTELSQETSNEIAMRLRWGPAAQLKDLQMMYSCNPEPGWVKEDFVSNPKDGYRFIKSLPVDNPYLNGGDYQAYIDDARKRQPREWYKAYIEGDWDAFVPTDAAIPETLLRQMRNRLEDPDDEDCIWGVDVARQGDDWTTVWSRRGTVFGVVGRWRWARTDITKDRIVELFRNAAVRPWRINIDDGGVGGGVTDQLVRAVSRGHLGRTVIGQVVAGSSPDNDEGASRNFLNKRAELFAAMRRLLETGRGSFDEFIDERYMSLVIGDLSTPRAYRASRRGREVYAVEPKPQIKPRLGRSPDDGDALLLTMHEGRRDYVPGVGRSFRGSETEDSVQQDIAEYHRLRQLSRAEETLRTTRW